MNLSDLIRAVNQILTESEKLEEVRGNYHFFHSRENVEISIQQFHAILSVLVRENSLRPARRKVREKLCHRR